jgi:hypothetical protein
VGAGEEERKKGSGGNIYARTPTTHFFPFPSLSHTLSPSLSLSLSLYFSLIPSKPISRSFASTPIQGASDSAPPLALSLSLSLALSLSLSLSLSPHRAFSPVLLCLALV